MGKGDGKDKDGGARRGGGIRRGKEDVKESRQWERGGAKRRRGRK